MTSLFASISVPSARFHVSLLVALIFLVSVHALHAETHTLTLSSATNNVTAAPDPAPTNSTLSSFPHLPTVTVSPKDDDADDGDSVTKINEHGAIITINKDREHRDNPDSSPAAIISTVGVFALPLLIVFVVAFFRYRRRRENLAMAREFLNKGMPVPPQLLDDSLRNDRTRIDEPVTRGAMDRRRGIILLCIGCGVSLSLGLAEPHSRDWAWGFILIVMGLGYLLSGWIELKQDPMRKQLPSPNLPPVPPH